MVRKHKNLASHAGIEMQNIFMLESPTGSPSVKTTLVHLIHSQLCLAVRQLNHHTQVVLLIPYLNPVNKTNLITPFSVLFHNWLVENQTLYANHILDHCHRSPQNEENRAYSILPFEKTCHPAEYISLPFLLHLIPYHCIFYSLETFPRTPCSIPSLLVEYPQVVRRVVLRRQNFNPSDIRINTVLLMQRKTVPQHPVYLD